VRKNKTDPDVWLELGRLFEARATMTKEFVSKNFFLQYSFFLTFSFGISAIFYFNFFNKYSVAWEFNIIAGLLLIFSLIFMWHLRYPRSGKKYYQKAVKLNPNRGEAYLYLGKIALRKNQKLKAWSFMEKALQLNTKKNQKKIKRELKLLYEQEFVK
jgi:tetratricopeptide (TPR) repeat protein